MREPTAAQESDQRARNDSIFTFVGRIDEIVREFPIESAATRSFSLQVACVSIGLVFVGPLFRTTLRTANTCVLTHTRSELLPQFTSLRTTPTHTISSSPKGY